MKNIVLGRDNIDVFAFMWTWFSDCSYLAGSIEYADDDDDDTHIHTIRRDNSISLCWNMLRVCDFRNEKRRRLDEHVFIDTIYFYNVENALRLFKQSIRHAVNMFVFIVNNHSNIVYFCHRMWPFAGYWFHHYRRKFDSLPEVSAISSRPPNCFTATTKKEKKRQKYHIVTTC